MQTAVIVDAVRSPLAKGKAARGDKPGGALSDIHPTELLGQVLRQLIERNGIDPAEVDDVIMGCVSQVGEQAGPVGRWAWLGAGLPEHVPSVTIDRRCGSSQQAADFAAQAVIAGAADIVVAGGVESMSRVPMGTSRLDKDPFGPSTNARYAPGLVPQGISAELIAAEAGLTRTELDVLAANSHQRAAACAGSGDFDAEIVPIEVTHADGSTSTVAHDETIRPQTTVEGLRELAPAFRSDDMSERFPEIGWHVTAGNSSQLTDGASAMLIMSEKRAAELGVRPRARFHAFAVASDDPMTMLTGPIPATEKILERTGLSLDDIDHYEVNEAFAPVPLAWRAHFDADLERLNPRGGAIALGHPLGASGARLMTTMLNALEQTERALRVADDVRGRRHGERDDHRAAVLMQLEGQPVLVTGAGSGLGRAVAERLVGQGAVVTLLDLEASSGGDVAADLGAHARFVAADVTNEAEVRAALDVAGGRAGSRPLRRSRRAAQDPRPRRRRRAAATLRRRHQRQPRRHVQRPAPGGGAHGPQRAPRRRSRRLRPDGLGRRVRGPDRPDPLRVVEGRRRRHDDRRRA